MNEFADFLGKGLDMTVLSFLKHNSVALKRIGIYPPLKKDVFVKKSVRRSCRTERRCRNAQFIFEVILSPSVSFALPKDERREESGDNDILKGRDASDDVSDNDIATQSLETASITLSSGSRYVSPESKRVVNSDFFGFIITSAI